MNIEANEVISKFGKSSSAIRRLKRNFLEQNAALAARQRDINRCYSQQPRRNHCKNCMTDLPNEEDFLVQDLPYVICDHCTHLNGAFEDSDEFCDKLYVEDGGRKYADTYTDSEIEQFWIREKEVYRPKAQYLLEVLEKNGESTESLSFCDFGCGAGYFLASLQELGMNSVFGVDVSVAMIEFASQILSNANLLHVPIDDLYARASITKADVVSLIGVLEHLRFPRDLLGKLAKNSNVQYVYLSVPMFSPTAVFEAVFEDQFHRHLGSAHTHLYTNNSLIYLEQEFGFQRIGEWWFGLDMADLYRNVMVCLESKRCSDKTTELFKSQFEPLIDQLQQLLDVSRLSSEVHLVWKKNTIE